MNKTDVNVRRAKNTRNWILIHFECCRVNVIFVYNYSGSISRGLFLLWIFLLEIPLQLRASQAHAIWNLFFFFRLQLCNYFLCALPAESASKLHVSCCGKYMTFGGVSLRENNADCAMPGPVALFFFFLAEQKSFSSPNFAEHYWRRVEQPLTTCGSEASFILKLFARSVHTLSLKVDVFLQTGDNVWLQLQSAVHHLSKTGGPSIPQSASIITIIIINISVLFLTKLE